MKFTVSREQLLRPLSQVANVVERKQTLPILSNVHMRLKENTLSLTATDLEIEVITRTGDVDGDDGETTVGARKFLDICRALPEGSHITFSTEDNKARVTSGSSRFILHTLPASEFPRIQIEDWQSEWDLDCADLRSLIEKTHFAMANQDVRYYLNGLFITHDANTFVAVATDGHRLAKSEISYSKDSSPAQAIVPRKAVQEMLRLLGDENEGCKLSMNSNHIRLEVGDLVFTSKLIEGRFPDYKNVIPIGQSNLLMLDRDLFKEALQRASILSNDKFRGIRMDIHKSGITVVANNPEQEEASEEIDVEYGGEKIEIGFNVNYVLDVLNTLKCPTVEMSLNDSSSSAVFREPSVDDTLYVVMPMRI